MLLLKHLTPLAQGRMRSVYPHPDDSGLLIKVIRPEVIEKRWGSGQPWYKARRRFRHYISYIRETAEYIATFASYGGSLPFAQKVVGFVETDLGLGLVTNAARDRAGNLAPPLWMVLRDGGFDNGARAALSRFINQVLESELVIADLNLGNIVHAWTEAEGNHFVLIDGIGLSNIFPVKEIFPSLNLKSKIHHIERICSRVNRLLPPEAPRFSAPPRGGRPSAAFPLSPDPARLVTLKPRAPLAEGTVRLVYEHPEKADYLIKVMRPELVSKRYGEGAAWFRRGRRYDPYLLFLREIREFVAAFASHGHSLPFAQKIRGLVETDSGLGLVTEAVRGPDGNLAPTLATLIAQGGFDAAAETRLETFLAELLECGLVVADLHERNVVYGCAANGERIFVMIDGIGSSNLLPLKNWSGALNRRSKEKRVARLRQRIARRVAAHADGKPLP